jgi:hypothetical protein
MNRVNDEAREKNAVDPFNAALVILKKEGNQFLRGQSDAHKVSRFLNCILTPKGNAIMEDIFAKCDPSIYPMQMTDLPEYQVNSKEGVHCHTPKDDLGSWFKVWILYLLLPYEGRHTLQPHGGHSEARSGTQHNEG